MKRVLIVKMWALGDILMATPILRALKTAFPDSSISWLVDSGYSQIVENNPLIDEVISFDSASWRRDFRYFNLVAYLRRSVNIRRELSRRNFDLVICMTPDKWWCLWFKAASMSIGLFPSSNPGYLGRFYTHSVRREPGCTAHNVDRYLLPMKALGFDGPFDRRIVLGTSEDNDRKAHEFLTSQPEFDRQTQYLVFHPGASQKTKCWPSERFARLVDLVAPLRVVITGSKEERGLAEEIRTQAKAGKSVIIAAGALDNIGLSAALVKNAVGVVTGDTSMLHIAAALETPVVAVYGSTRPNDYAPLFGQNALLFDDGVACAPCYTSSCRMSGDDHLACLRNITPEAVFDRLNALIGGAEVGNKLQANFTNVEGTPGEFSPTK